MLWKYNIVKISRGQVGHGQHAFSRDRSRIKMSIAGAPSATPPTEASNARRNSRYPFPRRFPAQCEEARDCSLGDGPSASGCDAAVRVSARRHPRPSHWHLVPVLRAQSRRAADSQLLHALAESDWWSSFTAEPPSAYWPSESFELELLDSRAASLSRRALPTSPWLAAAASHSSQMPQIGLWVFRDHLIHT